MKKKRVVEGYNTVALEREEQGKAGSAKGIFIAFVIVFIMLTIMLVMIKMNVGGFGRDVLRPILKDVPVVNKILPAPTDEEVAKESGYQSLEQAVAKINELEEQIKELEEKQKTDQKTNQNDAEMAQNEEEIAALKEKIKQLEVYETNQKNFAATKEKFYKEVISNDNVDVSDYTKWYEEMDADTAAKLYKEAVVEEEISEEQKALAASYAQMKPAQAAKIMQNMSGDMDTVVAILGEMSNEERGKILGEMDAAFAAKITKKIAS